MVSGPTVAQQLLPDLRFLYGDSAATVAAGLEALADRWRGMAGPDRSGGRWDQGDALLITYGDSITAPDMVPLAALDQFLTVDLEDRFSTAHLLPFYPFSSDDGFSVTDYREVRPDLGDWRDIGRLAEGHRLAFDVVLNHASQHCRWIERHLAGDEDFKGFAFEVDPSWDLSQVTRPRTSPLTHEFESARGPVRLWTTFSRDQVDLDFRNPQVLLEMMDVMFEYIGHGARVLRLDALPYLWKESGTTCIHLEGTHAALRVIRRLVDHVAPGVRLLAETNAPFSENLDYWGRQGDGAHWLYDFTVGPLMLHALFTGDTDPLNDWASTMPQPAEDTGLSLLHVTATHDGIGLRPAEGLLGDADIDALADSARRKGGHVGMRTRPDGHEGPYELNLTWRDAVRLSEEEGVDEATQVRRFITTQAIAMELRGIPGLYIHSLFGTASDFDLWRQTGQARSVNRGQLSLPAIRSWISDPDDPRGQVFRQMGRLLRIRRSQPALHPAASQEVIRMGTGWFAIVRRSKTGELLLGVTNFSAQPRALQALPSAVGWPDGNWAIDLIADESFEGGIDFLPWQTRWLVASGGGCF